MSEHLHAGEIRDNRHILPVRIYYEDTDFSGSVYHASYLRFMERGRTDYLRLLGTDQRALFEQTEKEAPGFGFVVRSMAIDFFKPARFSDLLHIITRPEEVKGASVLLHQQVMRDGELLVEAKVRVAFVSAGRAKPIPKVLRTAMSAHRELRRLPAGFISCKNRLHEMVEARRQRASGLSPRQSEGSLDPRGA
jgi:acyl-CoA thioester hydrolase